MFPDDTAERLIRALQQQDAFAVLSAIAYWVAIAGREIYRGSTAPHYVDDFGRLECLNEIQIILGRQLQSLLSGDGSAYADAALVQALRERSVMGNFEAQLRWAVDRAVGGDAAHV